MESFLEFSPIIGEGAAAQPGLSTLMQDLMKDKQAVAKHASTSFERWDVDKNGNLSNTELSSVYRSGIESLENRAAAGVLIQNFQKASDLASADWNDGKADELAGPVHAHLSRALKDDSKASGITRKDISTLSLLTSETEREKFMQDTQRNVNLSLIADGINTAAFGGVTAFSLAHLLAYPKTALAPFVVMVLGSLGLGYSGSSLVGNIDRKDIDVVMDQYKRRQAMLNSWQAPKQ